MNVTPDILNETELTAVRRRFDGRDRRWGLSCTLIFAMISFITFTSAFVDSRHRTMRLTCGWIEFLVSVALFIALMPLEFGNKSKPAPPYARALRQILIVYFIVLYTTIIVSSAGSSQWIAFAVLVPLLLIGFRFFYAETLTLHAALLAVVIVYTHFMWQAPSRSRLRSVYIFVPIFHGGVLLFELAAAREMRKEVTALWRERRDGALEQLRMRDELQLARDVQLSMLPEAAPQLEWVDLAGISLPASEVGGDYFDYFTAGDAIAIVCGDVAGHGLASGIVLSALRGGFILLRDALTNPADVLRRLNTMLVESSRRRTLVTAAILLLDRERGRAIVTSAGHPPVMVRRADGRTEPIEVFGPPLGARLPHQIAQRELAFAAGDVFVMHTDGIHESRNGNGEAYGIERLVATVAATNPSTAAAVRDAIVRDAETFRDGAAQADDVTVVVARML